MVVLTEAWISLGRVLECHSNRATARANAKAAKIRFDAAEKDRGHRHDDWFLEHEMTSAQAILSRATSDKIKAEKKFKLDRLTFIETYPEVAEELEKRLSAASEIHALAHNG